MPHNLESMVKIINRRIEYSLKPAYKKIIVELHLCRYTNLKKVYNELRKNLRDRKNKIANFIIEIKKL